MRVFLTHNPEDLHAYYGLALPALEAIAVVVCNRKERDLTTAELIEAAAGCEVIVAHRSTPGEAELFERSAGLVAFLRTAVDISTIDVEAASRSGVLVGHADKSFVPSTAELVLALMLDLSRNVSESVLDYRAGREPAQRAGRQLRGRTAGIIGYGAIGAYLADILVALGVEVLVNDPHVDIDPGVPVDQVSLDRLLTDSDFVVPLAASTAETESLIGAAELARMKPGAFLVNASRGEVLDERAVAAALDEERLAGLAMDVGRAPDQRPSAELAGRAGVVATPHLGGLTPENADAQAMSSVEQVAAMIGGDLPPRVVDPGATSRLEAHWAVGSDA